MPQTVTLDSDDGALPVFDTEPSGQARGGVIVLQEAFGVNDHIEDICLRFANEGYHAVAPHLFHRSGSPVIEYSRIEDVMPHVAQLSEAGLTADLEETLDYLSSVGLDSSAVGAVGFCMGGTVAFLDAVRFPLGAAVTFYGGGIRQGRFGMKQLLELSPMLQSPWLGLFGDRDRGIPVEDVEALRSATRNARVPTEILRYPDAEHGFFSDARESYNPDAAKDAWPRTLDWLGHHLSLE